MKQRANYINLASEAMQILMKQEAYIHQQFSSSDVLSVATWNLVKLRVSQMNQCAFCIDMHSKEAQAQGESIERIVGLSAWRDMPNYTEQEQAALRWAEHLTSGQPVDDETYSRVINCLGEQAVVDLVLATNAINSWNRVAKTFKPEVGSYQPHH